MICAPHLHGICKVCLLLTFTDMTTSINWRVSPNPRFESYLLFLDRELNMMNKMKQRRKNKKKYFSSEALSLYHDWILKEKQTWLFSSFFSWTVFEQHTWLACINHHSTTWIIIMRNKSTWLISILLVQICLLVLFFNLYLQICCSQ